MTVRYKKWNSQDGDSERRETVSLTGQPPKAASTRPACPEQSAPLWSRLSFHWFTEFAWKATYDQKENSLDSQSLWGLSDDDQAEQLSYTFQKNLNFRHGQVDLASGDVSILRALVSTFFIPFASAALCKLFHDCLQFASPVLMKAILRLLKDDQIEMDKSYWQTGLGYAFGIILCCLLQTCAANIYALRVYVLGIRVRTAVMTTIYRKSLSLFGRDKTVGEIVNLMSNDSNKLVEIMRVVNLVWSAPLQIFICLGLIYVDLGAIAVASGFLVMAILLLPLSGRLARLQKSIESSQMKDKDQRIATMTEILNGIKLLKLNAWEPAFKQRIDSIRSRELQKMQRVALLQAVLQLIWFLAPFIVSFITFAAYVLLDSQNETGEQTLTSEKAFVSLTLFHMLRGPLTQLPSLISQLVQVSVAIKRIKSFLMARELDNYVRGDDSDDAHAIQVKNGTFSWKAPRSSSTSFPNTEIEDASPVLQNVTMRIAHGELVAVIGQVGQGKSSLISALLGDLHKLSGDVRVNGRVAYVPQQAWLRNATLRENILFGNAYDHDRYWDVLERCALLEDIEMLPAGDGTEVGEKGINLSGGQKQRISIARALYANADIFLFDDPLSAVDAHVASHIFEKVLSDNGALKSKTRLLVTHSIRYLPDTHRVVVMKMGRIHYTGTYTELRTTEEFRQLADEFGNERNGDQRKSTSANASQPAPPKPRVQKNRDVFKSTYNPLKGKIIDKEHIEEGGVTNRIYGQYLEQAGRIALMFAVVAMLASVASQVASSFWLAQWSNNENAGGVRLYLFVYGLLGLCQGVTLFAGVLMIVLSFLEAARYFHNRLLVGVLQSPMSFFDTTPLGRIIDRFSRDVDVLDQKLSQTVRVWIQQLLQLMSIAFVICSNAPFFMAVIVPVGAVYYFIQLMYISTTRQLRRLESVTRSPIYSHFSETLQGASVIRAYGVKQPFIDEFNEKIDINTIHFYPQIYAHRWLSVRLDACASVMVFFTALWAILTRDQWTPGTAGLCLSYALTITTTVSALIRYTGDVELNIVSVERILNYIGHLKSETLSAENPPTDKWPLSGEIEFKNYSTRYRAGLPCVVRNLCVRIKSGERVGVVGRTGSGKSSLALALFRILEAAEGELLIDGVNLTDVDLSQLRSKLAIISQDPVLFSGSLRFNLDPFNEHSNEDLWLALEHAHLSDFVLQHEANAGLQMEIKEGGDNLSVGQRQLVCLARALLRASSSSFAFSAKLPCRIVVLDEATAAVDVETDAKIQETIRKRFRDCTVLTIAHRANTVKDFDKILVMDSGEAREFDSPGKLLENPNSLFSAIVHETKPSSTG